MVIVQVVIFFIMMVLEARKNIKVGRQSTEKREKYVELIMSSDQDLMMMMFVINTFGIFWSC